jgi:DNA-binding transcriptional LysR family regulator
MELDNLEAVKRMVAAGLGASIVPANVVSGGEARADIVSRPLSPPLARTLALVQRRDKPADTSFTHVRDALLTLTDAP